MLTIKAPIELKSASFSLENNGFADRIRGNYSVMGAHVSSQSLTHMLHTPPQLLVAEGEESYTGIQNNVYAFTEIQQTLISNAVNRILMSSQVNLNYQDRIYISSILRNLGIRDERRFMEEAQSFLTESENSTQLTKLYMENMAGLQELLVSWQERQQEEGAEREAEQELPQRSVNRLYMSIMNRLQTGMIYQIVQNLQHSNVSNELNEMEVTTSEQSYIARQLLLKQFRTIAAGETAPLIYRVENSYEEETRLETEGEEKMRERINSALLLEVIRSFDHAIAVRTEHDKREWMELRNSFYRSADHSLSRILIEAREGRSPVSYENNTLEVVNMAERRELDILEELFEETEQWTAELQWEREQYFENMRENFLREHTDYETQLLRERERMSESFSERDFEQTELLYRENNTEETLEEQLERINEQNTRNLERYREIRRILLTQKEKSSRTSDRERTIRESLRSLEDREHLVRLLKEDDGNEPTAVERKLEQIYKLLPQDTVQILKQMETPGKKNAAAPVHETEVLRMETELQQAVTERTAEEAAAREEQLLIYRQEEAERAQEAERVYRERSRELLTELVDESRTTEVLRRYEDLITRQLRVENGLIEEKERISRIVNSLAETTLLIPEGEETGVSREALKELIEESRTFEELRNYEELILEQLRIERGLAEGRERISRIENSPAETILLKLTGSGRTTEKTLRARREFINSADMVYRVEEQLSEEDVLATLEEYRRNESRTNRIVEEAPQVTEVHRVEAPRVIENAVRPVEIDRNREIAEMVEQGVRRQLGMISNEVYSRLEKRLRSEKARRGI